MAHLPSDGKPSRQSKCMLRVARVGTSRPRHKATESELCYLTLGVANSSLHARLLSRARCTCSQVSSALGASKALRYEFSPDPAAATRQERKIVERTEANASHVMWCADLLISVGTCSVSGEGSSSAQPLVAVHTSPKKCLHKKHRSEA